jgi:hypothetical protein
LPDGVAVLDHDANAIYMPTQASAVETGKRHDLSASSIVLAAVCTSQGFIPAVEPGGASLHWHPPDAVLDGSDIYLTLRHLRI